MPKYVVAFAANPRDLGKVVELSEDDARVGVREGRLRLQEEDRPAKADKPAAVSKPASAVDGAKASV